MSVFTACESCVPGPLGAQVAEPVCCCGRAGTRHRKTKREYKLQDKEKRKREKVAAPSVSRPPLAQAAGNNHPPPLAVCQLAQKERKKAKKEKRDKGRGDESDDDGEKKKKKKVSPSPHVGRGTPRAAGVHRLACCGQLC